MKDGMDPLGLDPVRQVGKPVVMAVQGICLTIGLELLLAWDLRRTIRGASWDAIFLSSTFLWIMTQTDITTSFFNTPWALYAERFVQ
jgi:hypothetical protein